MQKFWGLLFAVVLLAAFLLTAVSPLVGWWLPPGLSSYSGHIDTLFYWILGVTTFFFVLTEAMLVYNMLRFGAKPGQKAEYSHGNHRLEMLWTVVPGVILFLLAILQINVWADIKYPSHMKAMFEKNPEEFLQMEVTTRQWEYRVRYPSVARLENWAKDKDAATKDYLERLPERRDDVHSVNDIHTWKDAKVVVYLKTRDVGHSFFVPVLRVKQDSMPGRTIPLWFQAAEANTMPHQGEWIDGARLVGDRWTTNDPSQIYDLVCTQYCGTRHSLMRGKVYVHKDKADFLAWLRAAQANDHRTQPESAPPQPAAPGAE